MSLRDRGRTHRIAQPLRMMKRILLVFLLLAFHVTASAAASDRAIFLNAFGETATAYLDDAFLLLGTTADGYVADIIPKEKALEIAKSVQKRIRMVRGKLKAVSATRIAESDRKLIGLLDGAYACIDHQAWALVQFIEDKKSAESAKRFEEQRVGCLDRFKQIEDFYSTLPPSPEVPEPLSTR
jgi:hypothetical protein